MVNKVSWAPTNVAKPKAKRTKDEVPFDLDIDDKAKAVKKPKAKASAPVKVERKLVTKTKTKSKPERKESWSDKAKTQSAKVKAKSKKPEINDPIVILESDSGKSRVVLIHSDAHDKYEEMISLRQQFRREGQTEWQFSKKGVSMLSSIDALTALRDACDEMIERLSR